MLVGASELAEAALLSAREANVEIVGLVDACKAGEAHIGFVIAHRLADIAVAFDAVVLCDMRDPQGAYLQALEDAAALGLEASRVVGPALLRLRTQGGADAASPNAENAA